ncbi:MAG: hypothetical protein L0H70_00210, partial [Xanthomonadales bacterium]|nr:hypothetical protein [Xanthomonadales bacterium]
MNIWMRGTIFLVGLMLAGSAAAVTLSTDGDGQVLIYPYYTVNAERNSTLTLSNMADQAKAVKLDFRSGADGSAAFVLNVYLGAYDTWTGTLFHWGDGANAGPAMVSNDSSCTVPSLHAANLPTLPDGRHYLRPNASGQAAAPLGEGYVTAIEMGTLGGASAAALKFPYAPNQPPAPADCAKLVAAWQSGGDWQKDPSMDISAPSGGLSGTMTIIKVAQGTIFRIDATALKDFRVTAMHTAPEVTTPDLGDALSNTETGIATANIPLGNQVIQSDYPAERSIDAVSAVLMAQELKTHYDFRSTIGARTAFVLNMPTKRFYVGDKNHFIAPFGRDALHIASSASTLCPVVNIVGGRRNGANGPLYLEGLKPYIDTIARFVPLPCYATSVLALDPKTRPRSVLDSQLT